MLVEIYVEIDDFCKSNHQIIQNWLKESGLVKKAHPSRLTLSEVLTILVYYHHSYYQDFKHYYINHVQSDLRNDFPDLISYNRFVELIPRALLPLCLFLSHRCEFSKRTGIYYIDSAPWAACHPKRAHNHKVMKGFAQWGKTSVGWFYGLKYHLIINQYGELMNFYVSSGGKSDNNAKTLFLLTKKLMGWLFGDKGYLLSDAKKALLEREGALKIFSKCRKNMKKQQLPLEAKLWLRKRGVIESAINLTKNACEAVHTRHRSPINAFCNLFSSLVAYTFMQRKPSTKINLEARLLQAPNSLAGAA